ncbi:MAG: FecR family protein, partial [Prolixibacteraceae bacterium]
MNSEIQRILDKFIQGHPLFDRDLYRIRKLFHNRAGQKEIDLWLNSHWEEAEPDDIQINYDRLKKKLHEYGRKPSGKSINGYIVDMFRYYQRIAAFLFIPLIIGVTCYLFFSPVANEDFYFTEAPLGQKARVELPDGSMVWLNSGSGIRYSSNFKKKRELELKGEAFFDVQKSNGKPFLVHTSFLDVEVTGTRFNVNAYDDEPFVETALVEGKVNLLMHSDNKELQLDPGKVLSYSKKSHEIFAFDLNDEAITSWKENRLVFIDDDFAKLVRKIEKWYNVEVIYNPDDFAENKLTVRLLEGEQLDQLLEIIETAIGAKCTMAKNIITVEKINK